MITARGSFTIEATIVMVMFLMVLGLIFSRFEKAKQILLEQGSLQTSYQEAFFEKIEEIRYEKLHKEFR